MSSFMASLFLTLAFCGPTLAQDTGTEQSTLITNANIFDGENEERATGMSVLIEGNKISRIADSIPVPAGATAW